MTAKRLILHIGMHRTGSTSLQRVFSRNRRLMRALGVAYPSSIGPNGESQPKHNAIFQAISHEADYGRPHPTLGASADLISATLDQIASARGRLAILSAEGFSGERPVFADALAPLGDRFDVRVIIFLRAQDEWVESFYKQMVVSRDVQEARPFADFLAAPDTTAHLDYERIVGWWAERFGAERVRPVPFGRPLFDAMVEEGGAPSWLRFLPHARSRLNVSASARSIELVRQANAAGLELPRDAAHQIDRRFGASDGAYLDEAGRKTLRRRVEHGNQRLEEAYDSLPSGSIWAARHTINTFHEWRWGDLDHAQFWTKYAPDMVLTS